MLFSVFKVRNGKDGLVVEVDGIMFGCIMVFVKGTWMFEDRVKIMRSYFACG